MDYNLFAEEYNKLKDLLSSLETKKNKLTEDLRKHKETDVKEIGNDLTTHSKEKKSLQAKVSAEKRNIKNLNEKLRGKNSQIKTFLKPWNLLSSEQWKYREESQDLNTSIQSKEKNIRECATRIDTLTRSIKSLNVRIEEHANFNPKENKAALKEVEKAISSFQQEFEETRDRKEGADLKLEPILQELERLNEAKREAENRKKRAEQYVEDLTNADNSYERMRIHEACKAELGESSPKMVIIQQERFIKPLDRDIEKAHTRAARVGNHASRIIDTIIIDGNNMCYTNKKFLGLPPLKKAAGELRKQFKVIIVFDSNIRGLLKRDDSSIAKEFSDRIKTHIVATKNKADDTIIEYASTNERCFILSNDRFGEFNDKEAIRNKRIIRHEIIDDRVIIHELDVNIAFA